MYFGIGRYDIRWDPVEMWGAARVDTHALHTLWAIPPGEKRDLLLLHVDAGVCGLAPPPYGAEGEGAGCPVEQAVGPPQLVGCHCSQ